MEPLSEKELRAHLKLASRAYRKAISRHAAKPSRKRERRLSECRAQLSEMVAQSRAIA